MPKRFKHRLEEDDSSELIAHERRNLELLTTRPQKKIVSIITLRTDGGTQPRSSIDEETVAEYVGRMRWDSLSNQVLDPEHREWEPLTLYFDGSDHWLADGFHRMESAKRCGIDRFQAIVHQGTQRDAIAFSLGANARHGKRRTNSDKRRAVERALRDDLWGVYSDNKIAQLCAVSQPFVGKLRKELTGSGSLKKHDVRLGADGQLHEIAQHAEFTSNTPLKIVPTSPPYPQHTKVAFNHLARMDSTATYDLILAYPQDLQEWSAIVAHVPRLLTQNSIVLVSIGCKGSVFSDHLALHEFTQAAQMNKPLWMHMNQKRELAFIWAKGTSQAPRHLATVQPLILAASRVCTITTKEL